MRFRSNLAWAAVAVLALAAAPSARAADAPPNVLRPKQADGEKSPKVEKTAAKPRGEEFLRLVRNERGVAETLESAIVTFAPKDNPKKGPKVALIAAVHIGDKAYYAELNRAFATYDAVLYELVAPKGTRIPKGGAKGDNPVSAVQLGMTRMLELSFQLEQIDYTRPNMVHADMSPEQFSESMKQRGDSVWGIMLRMMGHAMAQQGQDATDAKMLAALFNRDRALAMKRVMAEQFRDMEGSVNALEGVAGATLISERNKVALEELRKVMTSGKNKKIAVFYGAGHMPDIQKRLKSEFHLVPVETRWLVAWDMKGRPTEKRPTENKPAEKNPARPAPTTESSSSRY